MEKAVSEHFVWSRVLNELLSADSGSDSRSWRRRNFSGTRNSRNINGAKGEMTQITLWEFSRPRLHQQISKSKYFKERRYYIYITSNIPARKNPQPACHPDRATMSVFWTVPAPSGVSRWRSYDPWKTIVQQSSFLPLYHCLSSLCHRFCNCHCRYHIFDSFCLFLKSSCSPALFFHLPPVFSKRFLLFVNCIPIFCLPAQILVFLRVLFHRMDCSTQSELHVCLPVTLWNFNIFSIVHAITEKKVGS